MPWDAVKGFLAGLILLPLFCAPALADGVGNFCPTLNPFGPASTCVVNNPVYVNVYWDSSPGQWNIDVGSSGMTYERIDAASEALLRSGYFKQLQQYKVMSVSMHSSMFLACGPQPPSMDAFENNDDWANHLVDCVVAQDPSLNNNNTIINLLLPPQVAGGNYCGSQLGAGGANHRNYRSIAVTILSTANACNDQLSSLLERMSHEMVEAATDPNPKSPTGYRNKDYGTSVGGDEIADLCSATVSFLGIGGDSVTHGVTQYWSDNDHGCVNPFPLTTPRISSVTVCGTGQNMTITLTGSFGARPWDLASNFFGGKTLYVSATITGGHNWSVGNILHGDTVNRLADTVGFRLINWQQGTHDTITLSGFDSKYGGQNVVGPGDTITVTVFSPLNGQSDFRSVAAPQPSSIFLGYQSPQANAEQTAQVTGTVLDSSNCGVGDEFVRLAVTPVAPLATAGSVNGPTTGADGSFAATFNAPPVAGNVTLKATAGPVSGTETIPVLPVLTSISPAVGTVAGGQQVTLSGAGFANPTTVSFSGYGQNPNIVVSKAATSTQASPDHHRVTLTTPQSPLPGDGTGFASVGATVNGVSGGSLQYLYIVPGKPFGTIQEDICRTKAPFHVTVTVYNADGSVDPVMIDLSSTQELFGFMVFQETVQSGVPFLISGGNPIVFTATNEANSVSTTITFKCNWILPGPGMEQISFMPGSCPSCGNQPDSAIWTYGEATAEVNSVVMSGRTARQLQRIYTVGIINPSIFAQLVDAHAFAVTRRNTNVGGTFIGQPISIALTERPGVIARIANAATVVFPVAGSAGQEFQIVHYAQAGTGFEWTAVKGTTYDLAKGLIRAPATETGIYALISIGGVQP